ncbi:MAG: hypothetical protein IPK60_10010 [Sandaracinaceae bacterium]|nr:hypothetical protein [Sandaracinaceae bacterium]
MTRIVALLSLVSLFVATPNVANACSCMEQSREAAFAAASDVFEGRVRSITREGPANGGPESAFVVEFDVVQTWKGAAHERVTVRTATQSAACGYGFREHTSYLVYARTVQDRMYAGLCSRTRLMSEAAEDIRAMGAGVTPVDIDPNATVPSRRTR